MAVSWPLVKHGTYDAGDVATAANFESDFNKVFDAVNQLHNRFSSFQISTRYSDYVNSATEWVSTNAGEDPSVVHMFKVPDWMQGLRIRRFSVANVSTPNVLKTYANDSNGSVKFRLATGALASSFNNSNYDDNWTATDVSTADFTVSGANGESTQNPILGIYSNASYPTVLENDVTSNNVVLPDTYVAVYFIGGVSWTGAASFQMQFDINILCDAMVPVP